MCPESKRWIDRLGLTAHVEGGYFREIYQAQLVLDKSMLPVNFGSPRPVCTHIYYLLGENQCSAMHRIKSDEIWHFYAGDPLIVYEICKDGMLIEHLLGNGPDEELITVIQAGSWFGARIRADGRYALTGCTVSPGFDYADFELADKETLAEQFPQHRSLITALCRQD